MAKKGKKRDRSLGKLAAIEFKPLGLVIDKADEKDLWELTFIALMAAWSFGEMGHEQAADEARRLREEDFHDPREMVEWFGTSIGKAEGCDRHPRNRTASASKRNCKSRDRLLRRWPGRRPAGPAVLYHFNVPRFR